MSKHRFQVIEYSSGFAIRDRETGQQAWLGDGVDTLFTKTGRPMLPGSEHFRRTWQQILNEDPDKTLLAYFRKENA